MTSLTPLELWASMGTFARGIVMLLATMSFVSFAVAVDRLIAVWHAGNGDERFVPEWQRVLGAALPADTRREAYDRAVRHAVLTTNAGLRRGLAVLATVGATAPFVGLVGTVAGIVNAFHEIATAGQGGIAQVSGGVAEALVTTAIGIAVAIPAVWLYNFLTQRIGTLLMTIETRAQRLAVDALTRGAS